MMNVSGTVAATVHVYFSQVKHYTVYHPQPGNRFLPEQRSVQEKTNDNEWIRLETPPVERWKNLFPRRKLHKTPCITLG